MKIHLDKIELVSRINGLQLKQHFLKEHCLELYYDTDLSMFIMQQNTEGTSRYTGKVLIPRHNVACAQVEAKSIPKHQPVGTPPERDTPSGKKRKHRTETTAKSALAERIEAREASKKSQD